MASRALTLPEGIAQPKLRLLSVREHSFRSHALTHSGH